MSSLCLPIIFIHLATSLLVASPISHHEVVRDWPKLPKEYALGLCSGIGVDTKNRVFVFHRSGRQWTTPFPGEPIEKPTVSVLSGETGELLFAWGARQFVMPHGLNVDHEGNLWLTDVGLHQIFKFTPEGKLLLSVGEAGVPGDDEGHFNLPTDVAVFNDGSFCVSDGYKNTRIVKFNSAGRFVSTWGSKGAGPGEFQLPHGIATDGEGRLYVCDRSNSRVQIFDAFGRFLSKWQGPHIGRPYGVSVGPSGSVYIIDGGDPALPETERGKAVILDSEGKVLDTFGGPGPGAGRFQLGHDIAVGPDGAVYVAEGTGQRVQKFLQKR